MCRLTRGRLSIVLGLGLLLSTPAMAGPLEKAKGAVDPDCTVAKAAKGAATEAVVGVRSNRCDVAETTRDTLGVDDRDQKKDDGGPLQRNKD